MWLIINREDSVYSTSANYMKCCWRSLIVSRHETCRWKEEAKEEEEEEEEEGSGGVKNIYITLNITIRNTDIL